MKRLWKIVIVITLITFWYWADSKDYFQSNYNDLNEQRPAIFAWQEGDNTDKFIARFRQHILDADFSFPRQKVAKVKLFKNIPMLRVLTAKTLKPNMVDSFVKFCNDSSNFDWGEQHGDFLKANTISDFITQTIN